MLLPLVTKLPVSKCRFFDCQKTQHPGDKANQAGVWREISMTMAEQVVIDPATQADLDELSETLRI
jgi:hypothetical protein